MPIKLRVLNGFFMGTLMSVVMSAFITLVNTGPGAPGGVTTGCSAVTMVPSAPSVQRPRVGGPSGS